MRTWTNLTWPGDPYRTGQQVYRRPAPRLVAFTTWPALAGYQLVPVTTAVVYLPLHRSRPVNVTGQTLTFGFRAASTSDPAEAVDVAGVADLDLMQARCHAAVLTGYELARDLATLQRASTGASRRGIGAVAAEWDQRGPATGRADLFDASLDLPGNPSLARACQQAMVSPERTGTGEQETRHPVSLAVERALAVALVCARHLGRYEWEGALDIRAVMAACAWDCLPHPGTGAPAAAIAPAGGQQG